MSTFFQQLIDLGDQEGPAAVTGEAVEEDLESMSKEQLATFVRRLLADNKAKRQEFEQLRSESTQLRSEYDAYKLKVESWQLKMKEARDEDRKLITQLRAAGNSGNADDVLVKAMNDTINKLKEELRKAHDDVAKEYKRRQDTEEARARFEETKAEEMAQMLARIDKMRDQMKRKKDHLDDRVRSAEARAATAERQLAEARANAHDVTPSRPSQSASSAVPDGASPAVGGDDGDGDNARATSEGRSERDSGDTAAADSGASPSGPSTQAISRLEMEVATWKARATDYEASRDELVDQVERTARQLDEAQEELEASEKKLFELRSSAEADKTRLTALVSELEKGQANRELEEKKLQRQIRVAAEEIEALKTAHLDEERALQARVTALEAHISTLEGAAQARDDAVGAAEVSSMRATEALQAERRQLQSEITTLERKVSEGDVMRQGLYETIEELRHDVRRRDDGFEELRAELEETSMRCVELEAQLTANHATVSRREDDVVALERERQMAKHTLALAQDEAQRLKRQQAETEDRLAQEREHHATTSARLREIEGDRARLQTELRVATQKVSDAAVASEAAQHMIRDLQVQLSEQGSRTVESARLRDDQSALVRNLEAKLRDAEARAAAESSTSRPAGQGGSAGSGSSGPSMPTRLHPSAVLQSAFPTARFSILQTRQALTVAVAVVLFLGFFYSWGHAPTNKGVGGDTDTVLMLKEKYAQALQAQLSCREQLKSMCPCPPPS